jgi:hypothetical protein
MHPTSPQPEASALPRTPPASLSQKLQLYQGLLKLLLNQTSKNPSSSLKNFLSQLGKPEMM